MAGFWAGHALILALMPGSGRLSFHQIPLLAVALMTFMKAPIADQNCSITE